MKKLIAFTLMLCLLAACAPATALEASPKSEPFTLYVTGDGFRFPQNSDVFLKLGETMNIADFTAGMIQSLSLSSGGMMVDLNMDGVYDIDWTFDETGSIVECVIIARPDASIKDSYTLTIPDRYNAPYSPLTFVFSSTVSDPAGSFELNGNEVTFAKPAKKDASSVVIPATVTVSGRVLPVTKIAPNAFKGSKKLTKVTIGANIKEIGKSAFQNCAKLKTVSGGANIEIIGDSAFAGCKALTKFTIGAKVTKIGKKAFYKCAALKKITIKSKLLIRDTVGSSAFKGIYKTATIKVPKAVKKDYTKWLLKKGVKKTMKIK